ncbi:MULTISPECIES: LON peptidase substrate-binding domain-containing protein [Pseudomonas]|uniref:LON peptidase substrate-binding domain-containing protein n=1 Tax=Pseudomonas spirodelae TaxID=3101751 RepID=A0ABU5PE46_9PSED|nr:MULTISPECIES: LON peptidase substrate-binding domain-containing protein [unclassified Pseudomonas]MBU0881840.1 LON peptidase substrate-binding domain-containing protein [Gammaproteobacteria bacterium]MBU0901589.1 LON peptidase substrate-binding domain-containing protein [Gammaproteobacteria bacterium]MBU1860257.1 LON peptidase substrate-binding domain-containing protein [Gammaproteobacteria bacterium]MDD2159238.1 LON peptidase substrate-binding domain-containing protein [Pseudomonas sp. MIL1
MTLPLFPLNTVLFPGCMLDLQVFEARYLDMVSRCMKQNQGFGVVCIIDGAEVGEAAGQFSAVGCEALIRDFQQRPNGLLGIRVEGGRRFRVQRAQVLPDQLALAEVEWLDEPPEQPLTTEHADLAALLEALNAHPLVASLGMPSEPTGQDALANQLAYLLPLDVEQKLTLLETVDAPLRLELLQQLLEQLQGERQ